jgi:glutamate--cysteine ligase
MYADAPMGTQDIEHLVSMFWPDARLKRFVEIRPADALPEQGVAGYTALIKGLFYFESSLRAVEDALGVEGGSWRLRAADVEKAIVSVNRRGFGGVLYGLPLSEWEDLLFSQARQALDGNEGRLLDWLEGFAHDKDWWQTGERP